uniref:Uncharacterized protein n=1 Tax=Staphylococcus phage 184DA TaxID=3110532 RepID=A0AAU6MX78_9CAUD
MCEQVSFVNSIVYNIILLLYCLLLFIQYPYISI